jgi:hypothetical protein
VVPSEDEDAPVIRLRFATARQAARQVRVLFMTAALVTIAGGAEVLACPMCFGAEESSLIEASKLGIFVLLGITLAVQGAFASFFFYLRKRAKQHAELELETEWSELQKPSGTR